MRRRAKAPVKEKVFPPLRTEAVKRDFQGRTSLKVTSDATPDPDELFDGEQSLSGKREPDLPVQVTGRRRKRRVALGGPSPETLDPDSPRGVMVVDRLGRFLVPADGSVDNEWLKTYGG